MSRKSNIDNSFADLVKRLNEMSNTTPEQERQSLMEAARQEPRILDDRQITLADIAKLAGIKEFKEPTKISPKAEKLIESITGEKSDITRAIEESDKTLSGKIIKEAKKISNRLDRIAELEAQLAGLKAEQKEEQTHDTDSFREVLSKDIQEYIKTATEAELVELYNNISDNEAIHNEESKHILVKTPETKAIIADAEKAEEAAMQEKEKDKEEKTKEKMVQEKSKEEPEQDELKDDMCPVCGKKPCVCEASGFQGQQEARKFDIRLAGDFDQERGTDQHTADMVKALLTKSGIQAEVEPSEADYSSVTVHTMSQPDAVIQALGNVVDESLRYTDELSENMDEAGSRLPSSMAKTKAKLDRMTPDEIRAFFKNREDFAKQASGGTIRPGYSAKELAQGQEFRYGREFAKGRPYSKHFENTELKK